MLGFLKMGMYPICKTYHTSSILTPTLGKKKENQPTKPQTKPHYPCSSWNKTLQLPARPVTFCTALPKMDLCSKWPVKRQRKTKPKGNGKHRDKNFSLSSGNHSIHFLQNGNKLTQLTEKKKSGQKPVTKKTI